MAEPAPSFVERHEAGRAARREAYLGEDAAHVIVVAPTYSAPAPDAHPADRLRYERGDEVPFDFGARVAFQHPSSLVVCDAEGEPVAGGREPSTSTAATREADDAPVSAAAHEAIAIWRRGDGFVPSDGAIAEADAERYPRNELEDKSYSELRSLASASDHPSVDGNAGREAIIDALAED